MRRISEADREEAIESLLIEADWHAMGCAGDLQKPEIAVRLVEHDALRTVWYASGYSLDLATDCLEAAALLRDGWSPGDPVVRRGGGS